MKTTPTRSVFVISALLFSVLSARADEASYAAVIKERDTVLAQILADQEGKRSLGTTDDEAIETAQLALYAFRRDVAPTAAEKLKQQELILQVFEKKLAATKSRERTGTVGSIQVLQARASWLEVKQVLEELKLSQQR